VAAWSAVFNNPTGTSHREILGVDIGSAEDGATWTAFLRGLVARGLSGVKLVVSDCHLGLKQAVVAPVAGGSLLALGRGLLPLP
jgi:hypothetical protein